MLTADPFKLGFVDVSVPGYDLCEYKGSGGNGCVFTATATRTTKIASAGDDRRGSTEADTDEDKKEQVIMKMFREDDSAACDSEVEVLQYLQAGAHGTLVQQQFVPTFVERIQTTSGLSILVETPVGKATWHSDSGVCTGGNTEDTHCFTGRELVALVNTVEMLHALHVAHRDIKPQNVLKANNHAMLIDFDAACMFDAELGNAWKGKCIVL